jgi:hypothetical protein
MRSKAIARTVLASVATVTLFGSTHLLAEDCVSVKGTILNTLHDPALGSIYVEQADLNVGGVSTVGVVELKGEKPIGKLKCALVGTAVGPGVQVPGSQLPPLPDFTHTISCDDFVDTVDGSEHSQLTFDTTGFFTGFDGMNTLYFTENSVPRENTGTGVFAGTTGGGLTIEGTSNTITDSIDMTFTGEVCLD